MEVRFNRGNEYFDTYYIYDDNHNKIGIIEDHCRGVKQQYFVGWKLDNPSKLSGHSTGETQTFDNREDAIYYSIGDIIQG